MSKRAKSKNATVRKEVQGDAPKCRRLFPFVCCGWEMQKKAREEIHATT